MNGFLLKIVAGLLCLFVAMIGASAQQSRNKTLKAKNAESVIKAGSVPEFTFYVPDKASSVRFGLVKGMQSVWMNDLNSQCKPITNGLQYEVTGTFLNKGKLVFDVLSLRQTDGVILRINGENLPDSLSLVWAFGAANGKNQPESRDGLLPEDCKNNVFVVERNGVILYYPKGGLHDFSVFYTMFPIETSAVLSDASKQASPFEFLHSGHKTDSQALGGMFAIQNGQHYYCSFYKPSKEYDVNYYMLPEMFEKNR